MPHECTNCGRTFPDGSKEMLSGCPDCGGNKFQFSPTRSAPTETAPSSDPSASEDPRTEVETDDPPTAGETVSGGASTDRVDDSSASRRDDSESSESVREWVRRKADENDRRVDTSDFAEWPDSARRPEDRTSGDGESDPDRSTTRAKMADDEDSAQANARTSVVSDGLPTGTVEGTSRATQTDDDARAVDSGGAAPTEPDPAAADGDDAPPEHGRVVSEPSGDRPSIDELRAELNEQFESIKIVRPGEYELNLMELYNREEYIISLQEDGRYVIDVPDSWRESDS